MSKKHGGGKKQNNRAFKVPANGTVTQLTPDKVAIMAAKMQAAGAPQEDAATVYAPGSPIPPTPGVTSKNGPRIWQFPVGYNIGQLPRSTEDTPFDTLRNLAALYDGVMLCQQAKSDLVAKLNIDIRPYPAVLAAAGGDESVFANDIARYKGFFEVPDADNDMDLRAWIRAALKDQDEIDALSIYVRPNRGGGVYSLELVDGATIKPLIDARGRKPRPPWPAYQQFWHGIPLDWYTADQMIYHRETPRTDSVYGLSRVERIIMRVNQALRKQDKDMARFTDGNLPAGILELPESKEEEWTPEEILIYQQVWDGMLGGNNALRSRLKVVEPGAKFHQLEDPDIMTPFDMFLLNVTVACFGLTMAELGFTENVNKSSGDSQENVTYRRALRPTIIRYADLFTLILKKYFKESRFYVTFTGFEESEDLQVQATAYGGLVKLGIISPTTAQKLMKIPTEDGEQAIPRYFASAAGPVFFDDLLDPEIRKAQKTAQLKGLELAQTGKPAPGKPGTGGTEEGGGEGGGGEGPGGGEGGSDEDENARAIGADLRRWRECAVRDMKTGRTFREFKSDVIPGALQEHIRSQLAVVESVPGVLCVFNALKETA